MNQYVYGAFAIVVFMLVGTLYFLNGVIEKKELEIEALNQKVIACTHLNDTLKLQIVNQNEKIESLRVDVKEKQQELTKWRSKPPNVKYKTITKIREVKSDECEDISNTIDAVRNLDYRVL